jgi:hypothetical protein
MAITSGAGPGIVVTTSAKSGTVKSYSGGIARLEDPITTGNNGNLMASPVYTGRLIYIDGGTGQGQTRFISGQTTGLGDGDDVDLATTEPWTTALDGTSTFQISYIIEDAATLTGLTLRTQSQVYEGTRRFTVGSGGGTFAFFFLAGDKAWEWDDNGSTTVGSTTVEDGGRFDVGYSLAGSAVSGGYITVIQNTAGELALDCKTGSETNFYDWNMRCSHANQLITIDGGTHIWKRGKTFQGVEATFLAGSINVIDWVWEGEGTSASTIRIEDTIIVESCTLTSMDGWFSLDDGLAEILVVRNCNFVNPVARLVRVHDDKTWDFVDPGGWLNTSTAISFEVDDLNEVNKKHRLLLTVTEPDGTAIEGAETYLYEGLLNGDLPTDNKQTTDASGIADSDALEEKYTFPSSVFTTATSGEHAVKVYSYARTPFAGAVTLDDSLALTGLVLGVTLPVDAGVVEASGAQAVEDGPLVGNIERHATGETDIRPIKVMHYDGGTGSVPTIGETITEGSASATLLDFEGTAAEGIVVLELWNGTEYTNNNAMSGSSSSFNGVCDISGGGSSFYEEYTWTWDLAGTSLQAAYDYQSAKFASRPHPIAKQDDAASFTTFTDEAKDETAGDVDLMPSAPATNDAFYFGDANFIFESITIDISAAATTSTIVWEYWNGSGWTALSGATAEHFTSTGIRFVTFTRPTDWATTSVDSVTAYWVRARQNHGTPSGQPVASRIWLDELIERLIEWGEGEHAFQITQTPSGFQTLRNVANTEGTWLANRGAGTVVGLTADDGTVYIPPATVNLSVTATVSGSDPVANVVGARVRIETRPGGVLITEGTTNSSGVFADTFTYTSDVDVTAVVRLKGFDFFSTPAVIEATGLTVAVPLQPDGSVNLP